jgi:hypothetical protein
MRKLAGETTDRNKCTLQATLGTFERSVLLILQPPQPGSLSETLDLGGRC